MPQARFEAQSLGKLAAYIRRRARTDSKTLDRHLMTGFTGFHRYVRAGTTKTAETECPSYLEHARRRHKKHQNAIFLFGHARALEY